MIINLDGLRAAVFLMIAIYLVVFAFSIFFAIMLDKFLIKKKLNKVKGKWNLVLRIIAGIILIYAIIQIFYLLLVFMIMP